jgi:hypothetical protein
MLMGTQKTLVVGPRIGRLMTTTASLSSQTRMLVSMARLLQNQSAAVAQVSVHTLFEVSTKPFHNK